MPKKWVVRQSCDFSISIIAETAEEAMDIAEGKSDDDWEEDWTGLEVDESECEPV